MGIARGAALVPLLSGMSMAYSQLVSAVSGAFLASWLGAEDYGTVNLARNIFVVALVVTPLGLDLALQRHLADAPEDRRGGEIAWLRLAAFSLSALVTVLLFVGGARFLEAHVFRHPGFGAVLAATVAALPFATDMAVLGGAYRGVFRPLLSVSATYFVQPTIRVAAILALIGLGATSGLWAVVLGTLISFAAAAALQAARAHLMFPVGPSEFRSARREAGRVLRYAPVLGLSTLVFTVARSLDTIALGTWGRLPDVGRYAVVLTVGQLVAVIGIALGQTLGASVAAASRDGDPKRMAALIRDNMAAASMLCAPFCVAVAVWGSDIDLLLGPSYRIAAPVFAIAAGSQWLMTVTHGSSAALSMTGRHMTELGNNILALAVQVLACALLVPRFGLIGAAAATLLTMLAINAVRQVQIAKLLGRPVFGPRLLLPLAVSGAAAVPVVAVHASFLWRAWWLTGLFAASHVVLSFAAILLVATPKRESTGMLARLRPSRRPRFRRPSRDGCA